LARLQNAQGPIDPDSLTYEQTLELQNWLGHQRELAARHGASLEVIHMLPTFVVEQESTYLQEQCNVCKENFMEGDALRSLQCVTKTNTKPQINMYISSL
jgi:hypothetical protein